MRTRSGAKASYIIGEQRREAESRSHLVTNVNRGVISKKDRPDVQVRAALGYRRERRRSHRETALIPSQRAFPATSHSRPINMAHFMCASFSGIAPEFFPLPPGSGGRGTCWTERPSTTDREAVSDEPQRLGSPPRTIRNNTTIANQKHEMTGVTNGLSTFPHKRFQFRDLRGA